MFNLKILGIVVGVLVLMLIVGGAAFTAGASYGNTQAQNTRAEFFQNRAGGQTQSGQGQLPQGQSGQNDPSGQSGRGGQLGRIAAAGIVKNVQGNKIEVTMPNNSTITVTVDAQTQMIKTVAGAIGDIQPGMRISVTSDQTGSNITARLITIQRSEQQ